MHETTSVDESAVIKEVRWRYRICNYLFSTGALWLFGGNLIFARIKRSVRVVECGSA